MTEQRDISGHIAIIGMDGRFPGARNLDEYWRNLLSGEDNTRELTEEELLAAGESRETINDPNYIRRCAFLQDADQFDARFFGIAPRDAAVMDPQHRLFLEVAWAALEDAGYDSSRVPGPVAVFAGSGMSYYGQFNVFTNKKLVGEMGEWLVRHTANDRNFLSTLVSYKMNLKGPSMNVQTACSSALVATHMAVQSLLSGEADMAIAGGSTINFPQRGYKFNEGEILSSDGRCRAFDVDSNGTVFGSGCGAVVLRRLEDALEEGDVIDAVICGSAINNDGSNKVGFLAPSVEGQTEAIAQAISMAQVDPASINFVETHGTGTVIGDPIEVTALRQAYGLDESVSDKSCGIGSVKTNIGHLGEAAGVAGLIKLCLAMRHKVMPASLHFTAPNPGLGIEVGPYFVVDKNTEWKRGDQPRRAAITALGAGGTNAHMILEEPPEEPPADEIYPEEVLLLSAKTPSALQAASKNLAEHLKANPDLPLADVAFTLREGRRELSHRRAVYCRDSTEAVAALSEDMKSTRPASEDDPSLTFMFPGGGAQYANMGRDLYESEPVYREAIDALAKHAMPLLQMDIRALIYCAPEDEEENGIKLQSPRLSLPALFSTSYALAKLLLSWGMEPDAMIGHSMGEYVAACLAGVFSPEDGIALVIERGRLFEQVEEGGMLAVQLSEREARAYMDEDLGFAALNAPSLSVASGTIPAIEKLQARLESEEIECTRVRINVAAHSHLLEPILPAFQRFCEKIDFQTPTRRFVSNLSGKWAGDEVTEPAYWVRHLRSTVQFRNGIAKIFEEGETVLLEVGPGRTLASVARQQKEPGETGGAPVPVALPTLRHPKETVFDRAFLFGTVGKIWGAGRSVDWERALGERFSAKRVHLPSYPFEHERYWIDAERGERDRTELTKRQDVGDWFHVPTWRKAPVFVSNEDREKARQWIVFTDQIGVHGRLRSKLRGRVISVRKGLAFSRMDADVFEVNPSRSVDFEDLLSSLDMDSKTPLDVLYLWPVTLLRSKMVKLDADALEEASFDGLLSLLQAAGDLDWNIRLHVVGNGAVSVAGERMEPTKALSIGPVRVGARELAHVTPRLIDWKYDPIWDRMKQPPIDQLFDELVCGRSERVVALRDGERFVEGLSDTRLPPVSSAWSSQPDATFLITGGFGGIGREVARELARQGSPTLILVGRAALPPQSVWKDASQLSQMKPSLASRCRFAASLEQQGAKVVAEAVDISDPEATRELIARHPKITGVFHAAGVLEDGPIQAKTHEGAKQVLAAKVRGASNLADALNLALLDHFVLFSSSSSRLGLRGQVDYTAANAYLDALACDLRAQRHENVVSINWGTWRDVGMAARIASGVDGSENARVFSTERDWVIGEHRISGGQCVMPGTGYLNLLFSALSEKKAGAYRARDVLFLRPFYVQDGAQRTLDLRFSGTPSEGDFEFLSDSAEAPHVTGSFEAIDDGVPLAIEPQTIRARLNRTAELKGGFLIQDFVEFGERWGNLEEIAFGQKEALAKIRLGDSFVSDLKKTVLHPAMLDMATGGAQLLIDDFDQDAEFFVPFSYGSFRFYGRLEQEIFSYVEFLGRQGDTAEFNVTISDVRGNVLAKIDSFLMKQVDRQAFGANRQEASPSEARTIEVDATLRALVSQGTTAEEGMEVIRRVLGHRPGAQIFATPFSMDDWIAHTDQIDRELGEDSAPSFTIQNDGPREEPKNRLEEELLALWSELLGVGGLGVLDDFFELGGQSLVAARMFVRIRKKFGVSLPLSALFAAPTIRALSLVIDPEGTYGGADELESESDDSHRSTSPKTTSTSAFYSAIVAIQPQGSRPPFFCMPGMGGNPLGQRFLSERLGKEQPFYGLQARGVDGAQEPHTQVEEMAREYIQAMRTVQSEGPYYLGGFSGGGVVAYEIAQQLTREGEGIALLALLDAYNPLLPSSNPSYKAKAHLARSKHFGVPHVAELAKWKIWHPIKRSGVLDKIQGTAGQDGASNFETERAALDHKMMSAWIAAEKRYRPEPYSGDAVLFRSEWDLLHGRMDVVPEVDNGWSELVQGELAVIDVPGTHDSFMLEPNVRHVANGLAEALKEAVRRQRPFTEPPGAGPFASVDLVDRTPA